jgi:hypothetical protein
MMRARPPLQADCKTIPARRRQARHVGSLFGVLLAILVAGTVPAVHDHDRVGFYDEECPLVWLAVPRPATLLPSVPAVAPLAAAPDPVPVVLVRGFPDVSRPSFDPRAPPPQTPLLVLAH